MIMSDMIGNIESNMRFFGFPVGFFSLKIIKKPVFLDIILRSMQRIFFRFTIKNVPVKEIGKKDKKPNAKHLVKIRNC